MTFNTFNGARTWESNEPNSLVSGSVSERMVHTNWKLKKRILKQNLVINTIKQQVVLVSCNSHKLEPRPRPPVVKPAADSRPEALDCLGVKTNLSASSIQNGTRLWLEHRPKK